MDGSARNKNCVELSVCSGEPGGVGIEPEEGDHAQDHEVGVEAENDAAVIPAPAPTHVAGSIHSAGGCEKEGNNQKGIRAICGEIRQHQRECKAQGDDQTSTKERWAARIEDVCDHSHQNRPEHEGRHVG